MAQLFKPSATIWARALLAGAVPGLVLVWALLDLLQRSPRVTEVHSPPPQDPPFNHKVHSDLGLDCRYCHASVEEAAFAGMPDVKTCINCHSMVWTNHPALAPVRERWQTRTPLVWRRVDDLPDFTYFNHAAHLNKGVGCSTCHGRVDQMTQVFKTQTLYMQWCLECHRAPWKFVRPRETLFDMAYIPPADQRELGVKLVDLYGIDESNNRLMDCYTCHR